MYMVWYKG